MRATAEVKWAVYKVFDAFFDAIANGRIDEAMACWSDDPDAALYGSEISDVALGPAAIRSHLAEYLALPDRLRFTFPERLVLASGNVAWLTADGTVRTEPDGAEHPYRITAIFARRRDQWLWQLFSGSVPT